MFRGAFEHTIDDKGRVSVPSKFRDIVLSVNDDRVVVTNFRFDKFRCLDVYPFSAWAVFEERMRQQPPLGLRTRQLQHFYVAGAHDCQLDKQGRILLPTSLRTYANLDRVAMITGSGEKFNIWNRDVWNEAFQRAEDGLFADDQFLNSLGV